MTTIDDRDATPVGPPPYGGARRGLSAAGGRRLTTAFASALVFVIAVVIWHAVVALEIVDEIIVPYPADVVDALGRLIGDGTFWHAVWITTYETVMGFLIGVVIGFVLGALLGTFGWLREVLYPYVIGFQGLPKVVLAPLFFTALGFGIESKIAMAAALAFFPVLINTMVGLTTIDVEDLKLMRSYDAGHWSIFRKLALPHSLPLIFAGLKTSLTFALIGAIVAEFIGATEGLGFLLNLYANQLKIPDVWAVMVALAVLGVVLYGAIALLDRKIVFWHRERRLSGSA